MKKTLRIDDLHVSVEGKEILKGVDLVVPSGDIHALMGPNGSGKSTLANALMGHPNFSVTSGSVSYGDQDILSMTPNERARSGIFLAFQYPQEISGVRLQDFLRAASMETFENQLSLADFTDRVQDSMKLLEMDGSYLTRSLNEGFSGGEKKRAEVLQLLVLNPGLAILDETDSGLDIDALRIVAEGVDSLRSPDFSALIITHYQRILDYLQPDKVHVMHKGRIAMSGGSELARKLEEMGYEILKENQGVLAG